MLMLVYVVVTVGFPALTLRAWRKGGNRALWLLSGAAFGGVIALALILASTPAGNRLTPTEGYARVASGVLRYMLLSLGLPMILSVVAVRAVVSRVSETWAYPLTVLTTFCSVIAGLLAAITWGP
jgi:hypothetical protein